MLPGIFSSQAAPISCAYPLGATSGEVSAFGFAGRLSLSDADQTGTYTAAGINQSYGALPTNPASPATIDLATGKKVVEFRFVPGSIGGGEGGQIDQDGLVATVAGATIAAVRLRTDSTGYALIVLRGASTVASQSISLIGGAVTAGIEFDSAAGTFSVIANGSSRKKLNPLPDSSSCIDERPRSNTAASILPAPMRSSTLPE